MINVSDNLALYVADFKEWINSNYTAEEIEKYYVDDAGFPEWTKIEVFFKHILDNNIISTLLTKDKENLLYLIARNWDIGSMINWLSDTPNLSNLGNLKKGRFFGLSSITRKFRWS